MAGLVWVIAAAAAFVGTHLLMSHPLRAPIAGRVGEGAFLGLYSLVAAVTLVWLVLAWRAAPQEAPLWPAGDGLWALVSLVMLLASVLFVGSLIGNPALPNPGATAAPAAARGVFTITRHPMMWSIALWAACHAAVFPATKNLILCAAIALLALIGAAGQDAKKARLQPKIWPHWLAVTSYWPFAAVASGRARLGGFNPAVILGGLALWLVATWAHIPSAHIPAGPWRWI
jgi:uncharacterized membrane protein